MPRRTSFAEVSRAVTKKKSEFKKRASSVLSLNKLKKKESSRSLNNPEQTVSEDVQEQENQEPSAPTPAADDACADKAVSLAEESETGGGDSQPLAEGEESSEVVVLGEDAPQDEEQAEGEEDEEGEEKKEEGEEEEEKKSETETTRRWGKAKKLTKKQLRLQQERLEEEQEREERRRRREERRQKKELARQKAEEEATQSFDEVAYKESIYEMVKTSLGLVMQQGELNITVDNLTPLMKSLGLDTGDEDVKDLILECLLSSYGLVDPQTIDAMILRKKMEQDLDDVEDCVDAAFAIIDQDRDGLITHTDVYRFMIRLGEVLWDDQVSLILQAADMDGDGRISKKDLFLFLLGQEKTVKLEDQILNKYASKDGDKEAREGTEQPSKTPQSSASTEADATATSTPTNTTTSLAATLKATAPVEDPKAAERRKKMFGGYVQTVIAAHRFAQGAQSPQDSEKKAEDVKETQAPADEGISKEDITEAEKSDEGVEAHSKEGDPEKGDISDAPDDSQTGAATTAPIINVVNSDWSDSGHVGSDVDDVTGEDSEDEEFTSDCPPLALDEKICSLPPPDLAGIGSPRSPRSRSSSSSSPRVQNRSPVPKDTPRVPPSTPTPNEDGDLLQPASILDLDPARGTRSERTSEYDSDVDGDEDSLPETSQQKLILQEIEQQVLHTEKALKEKGVSVGGVALKSKYAVMISGDLDDGCESVVESEIHPVYVPRCARDARSGTRMNSFNSEEEEWAEAGGRSEASCKDRWRDRGKLLPDTMDLDLLTLDDANSMEILSKGYVSFTSPRSFSTTMTKPHLNDVTDDVNSVMPLHDLNDDVFSPSRKDRLRLKESSKDRCDDMGRDPEMEEAEEEEEEEVLSPSDPSCGKDVLLDGVPADLKPAWNRIRQLSARSRPQAPLRRSLTCHTVTVKDLSTALHPSLSPPRGDKASLNRRTSSTGPRSFPPPSLESSSTGRPSSPASSSPNRRDPSFRRSSSVSGRQSTVSSKNSAAARVFRRGQSFDRRRAESITWTESPASRGATSSRVHSPTSRLNTYRSQGFDSHREAMDSVRSQKTSRSRWESSYWGPKDSSRSQLPRNANEGWRSHRDTARSHGDTARSHRDTARSHGDTARSPWDTARSHKDTARSHRDTARSHKDTARSPWDTARSHKDTARSQRDGSRSQRDLHFSRREPAHGRMGNSTYRSGVRTDRSYYTEDEDDEVDQEFRFYGPNFDLIMSQKGEPEELLRESLYRDIIVRTGARQASRHDSHVTADGDTALSPADNRKAMISRQLEKVKEMEALIKERRENLGLDWRGDGQLVDAEGGEEEEEGFSHHRDPPRAFRRSRTLMHIQAPSTITATYKNNNNNNNNNMDGKSTAPRVRPKSCMSGRRSMSSVTATAIHNTSNTAPSAPKVVTIADSGTGAPYDPPASDEDGETYPPPTPEPAVHVVDLSSLLSQVNSPSDGADDGGNQTDRSQGQGQGQGQGRGSKFKPLARVLVAYENARRRQAATAAAREGEDVTTTSISRQLQQGIPYRPPTPPPPTPPDTLKTPQGSRKTRSFEHSGSRGGEKVSPSRPVSSRPGALARNCSFMLCAKRDRSRSPSPKLNTTHKTGREEWDFPNIEQPRGHPQSSVTLEFPERSVCVVKPRVQAV